MIEPEDWFTIYALARRGAIQKRLSLTTRELGRVLGVSQQTASRRVLACVERGLLKRTHVATGIAVQLTEKGQKELLQVLTGLETAFAPPSEELVIEGIVVTGLGEGAYYVDAYSQRFREALGFVPFPGTLNVKVVSEESQKAVEQMKQTPPLVVTGFSSEGRTFGDVICYRVRINNEAEGAVVIAQRTHHSTDVLEVISPANLRFKLKLDDQDPVMLRVVPLHMAT
jgi:riboflavin kinase